MKKIKALVAALALAAATGTANAGIPVIDAANLANSIQQVIAWGQQYTQMVEQVNQLRAQLDQLKRQYEAVTGSYGVGAILQEVTAAAQAVVPGSWQEIVPVSAHSLCRCSSVPVT